MLKRRATYSLRGWLAWSLTFLAATVLTLYTVLAIRLGNALVSVPPLTPAGEAAQIAAGGGPGSPADWGLPAPQDFTLDRGDVQLAGWYFDNPADGGCGVVLLHGRGGTRFGILAHAPLFWRLGCDLVSFDARQHGDSRGGYGTFGAREAADTLAAVDWLAARAGLDRPRIGLFGISYGAATGLMAAAEAPDLAFVVADSAFADLRTLAFDRGAQAFGAPLARVFLLPSLWLAGRIADFDPWAVSAEEAVRDVSVPILLIHSAQDDVIPLRHAERIAAACNPGRCTVHLTDWGAPHGGAYAADPAAYEALLDAFLVGAVPGFGLP